MQPFTFKKAEIKIAPILVASPHSGRIIPNETIENTRLSQFELRMHEDFYMDEISFSAHKLGLDFIKAEISRIYLDLNRSPNALDHLLIDEVKPKFDCPYTKIGIGLIPRLLGKNTIIHINKLKLENVKQRIDEIHIPYHNSIQTTLEELKAKFGRAILLDMHSMPERAMGELDGDIIIGNRFGRSCDLETTELVKKFFKENGLKVRLNHPFAGGYSTDFHAKKLNNIKALQIEINRKLYFDEKSQSKTNDFKKITTLFDDFFQFMIANY